MVTSSIEIQVQQSLSIGEKKIDLSGEAIYFSTLRIRMALVTTILKDSMNGVPTAAKDIISANEDATVTVSISTQVMGQLRNVTHALTCASATSD